MPVILKEDDYDAWLTDPSDAVDLLRRFEAELMRRYPVSSLVNHPENDAPACSVEVPEFGIGTSYPFLLVMDAADLFIDGEYLRRIQEDAIGKVLGVIGLTFVRNSLCVGSIGRYDITISHFWNMIPGL